MFEVVDMDGKRIDKVLATPVELPDSSDGEGALPWSDADSHALGKQR